MGTTIAIFLLSFAVVLLGYGVLLQKWRVDALQQALETHIMLDNQTLLTLKDIMEKQRKEHTNDSNG